MAFREPVISIHGNRTELNRSAHELRRFRPDVIVDAIAFTASHGETSAAAARDLGARLVVLSSGDVYRANDIVFRRVEGSLEPTPLTEGSPLRDRMYPYKGMSLPRAYDFDWDEYDKVLVERATIGVPGLRATALRLPMLYGPGDCTGLKRRFLAFVKRMDDGRPAILLDARTAQWCAPWGCTLDVADAVRLVVEHDDAGRVYNVAEPGRMTMADWVHAWASIVGWKGDVVIRDEACPPPSFPRALNLEQHLDMDSSRIRRELGYRERLSRREALTTTIAWDREHPTELKAEEFDYEAEDRLLKRKRDRRTDP